MNQVKRYVLNNIQKLSPYVWNLHGAVESVRFSFEKASLKPHIRPKDGPIKVCFVTTWFGKDILGGAESECYGLVKGFNARDNGIVSDVMTTTLKEFSHDWNDSVHKPGTHVEEGITVHRYDPLKPRRHFYHVLNGSKLMEGGTQVLKDKGWSSPLSDFEQSYYLRNMVYSPDLIEGLRSKYEEYDFFIYIPYMFNCTAIGGQVTAPKSIVIPCLHDERYAFMNVYKDLMSKALGSIYHVKSEKRLAENIYGASNLKNAALLGEQVNTGVAIGSEKAFREKFDIKDPFILYAGRKITGKNLHLLVDYFKEYKRSNPSALKLVILGKEGLSYAGEADIIELGFVSSEEKFDVMRAASIFCQPSINESFSIVLMEAWLQETPALVHSGCEVTKDHVDDSNGGHYFANQEEFDFAVDSILDDPKNYGANGRKYVLDNYTPEIVFSRFEAYITELDKKLRAGVD